MPKSASLTCPSHGMSTFDGFTSRWMTGANSPVSGSRAACAAASAAKTRDATKSDGAVVERARPLLAQHRAAACASGSPSTYSSTMTSCPSAEKKSKSLTIAGCDSRA